MNTTEAAVMLAKASAYDRRTVGRADAEAWAEAMSKAHITLDDALEAVAQHFQESSNWMMPNHIILNVKAIRRARVANADLPVPPAELANDQVRERGWIAAYWDAVKTGRGDAQAAADRVLGIIRADDPQIANPGVTGQLKALAASKAVR